MAYEISDQELIDHARRAVAETQRTMRRARDARAQAADGVSAREADLLAQRLDHQRTRRERPQ